MHCDCFPGQGAPQSYHRRMDKFWEFLRKLAHHLKGVAEVSGLLAALMEVLLGKFGPEFGFGAA
jgi:hypothetical protein